VTPQALYKKINKINKVVLVLLGAGETVEKCLSPRDTAEKNPHRLSYIAWKTP
jgi:hypothetical protein